jgi:transcriptional regulator with XRE-family HTH domain
MTRRDLEDLSDISVRQIAYLESDEKDPGRETLEALAKALGSEVIEAAFPELVVLGRFRKRSTLEYLTPPDWGSAAEAEVLVPALA